MEVLNISDGLQWNICDAYRSFLRQCHQNSPSLHHRGSLRASSDSYCHTGGHSPLFVSHSAVHQNGPDTGAHHHKPGPCQYTSSHGHIGTDLYGHKTMAPSKSCYRHSLTMWCLFCVYTHLTMRVLYHSSSMKSFTTNIFKFLSHVKWL